MTNENYSESEINILRNMASKCPFSDGKAVYRARTLLTDIDPFNTEYLNQCEYEILENNKMMEALDNEFENNIQYDLSPNPSNGNITIRLISGSPEEKILLSIYNISGQIVKEIPCLFDDSSFTVNIGDLQNGIYLYEIKSTNSVSQKGKLILIKP